MSNEEPISLDDPGDERPPFRRYSATDADLARFLNRRMYRGFEGGSIDLAKDGDTFCVIINESAMADFMDEEDQGHSFTRVIAFDTEAERAEYLARNWPPRRRGDRRERPQ